jgi:hypothetical protein
VVAGYAVKDYGAAGVCFAATPALVPGCFVGCSTCCVGDVGLQNGVVHVASSVLAAGGGIAGLASLARLHGGACGHVVKSRVCAGLVCAAVAAVQLLPVAESV